METLASDGYVVMPFEHTGNDDARYQADWLGRRLGLDIGPKPSISAEGNILQRTKDVSFVIERGPCGHRRPEHRNRLLRRRSMTLARPDPPRPLV